ncbi:type II secretion system minor pseudopilin GspH [Chromatiaceae bacterium AAb-1]|nr:type II secretion system minor pseudopilin GspH [Chromatiaceae bacterium AAb-1]
MRRAPAGTGRITGFTLLEVMLVLLLIGLLATVVVVNFSGDSRDEQLNKATEQFQQVFQFVAETAMLKQQEWGLHVDTDRQGQSRYVFLFYRDDKWHVADEPQALRPVILPENISLRLEMEGLPGAEYNLLSKLEWQEEDQQQEQTQPALPQVFILSSGEISPFKLIFSEQSAFIPLYSTAGTDFTIPLTRTEATEEQP